MTPTPVGMRCPECSRERTKVRTARSIQGLGEPMLTHVLIAVNVVVWLAEGSTGSSLAGGTSGGTVFTKGALFGPLIAHNHEYWRLLSAGFLHLGFLHLLFNMMFLYFMGPALEQAIGRFEFAAVYFASLLAGSFGALLFQPDVPTVGASGAAFGVLGALIVVARARGIPIWQSGLGATLAINIVFSLSFRQISIGGHLGGLVGGLLCGVLIVELAERRRLRAVALAGCVLVAAASVAGAIAVAGGAGIAPNGIGIGA
jgi:membrane associated rhomboid family serine protease